MFDAMKRGRANALITPIRDYVMLMWVAFKIAAMEVGAREGL